MAMHNNIKALRKAKGLSQVQLAARVGVAQGTVSYWDNRTTHPTAAHLQKLSEVLGVSVADIFTEDHA